ncbi:hypothetical protein [Streptomyces sp. ICBB 8177]|uniref:Rv1733c family protein n=1 Tax=Streptomyces sp. ICBB 8177 TaxID=563922 RepID=UPI000D67B13B|nr:hypothetical protein [Streptomyces sp. ICBB 8177]PWI41748.1 hypothetical protein CK485_23210 [Streptomyces sp. ICBB 8177]
MRAVPGLWRWRANPLRRRGDVVEAWAGLATLAVVAVGAPAAGLAAGGTVGSQLRHQVAVEQAHRHEVRATVLSSARRTPPAADTDPATGQSVSRIAVVRWTMPDGSVHDATVRLVGGRPPGAAITLWADDAGRLADRPMDTMTAVTNAVAAGLAAAAAVTALAFAVRRVIGWRMMRARLAEWEREWARVSQDWGRAGAEG